MTTRSRRVLRPLLLVILLGNLLPTLAATPALAAGPFTVRTTADTADATPGDGTCDDGTTTCTLRAAIQESNALAGADTIDFSVLTGAQTISLTSPLPVIGDGGLTIDGTTQPGFVDAPIIRIDGSALTGANEVGLDIQSQLGTVAVRGLIITNFPSHGIRVSNGGTLPPGVTIAGNYIGTDGTNDLGNARLTPADNGILVSGRSATIGGTTAADRNVISGNGTADTNGGSGILVNGGLGGSTIQGNYIGITANGVTALGQKYGVTVEQSGVTIGGTSAGARNVISGNAHSGVNVTSANATNAVIAGNYIGTNAAGIGAVENTQQGILFNLAGTGTTVGGAPPGSGNVITGGVNAGIYVLGTSGTTIRGNSVGVNAGQDAGLGLTAAGVRLQGGNFAAQAVSNTTIDDNVIGGAQDSGILIQSSTSAGGSEASNNDIVGNFIGTDRTGTRDLGNGGAGVEVTGPMTDLNRIGTLGNGNVIANNGDDGVAVAATSRLVRIRGNEIHDNGGLGIDLIEAGDPSSGVTPNDAGDGDGGANDLLNTPTLIDVVQNGTDVDYSGSLDTQANVDLVVDVYRSAGCDLSGSGEGTTHVASDVISSGPGGDAAFTISAAGAVTSGEFYTATATDTSGNTSEFSTCLATPAGGTADLTVSIAEIDSPVTAGQRAGFFAEYANHGPDTAAAAELVIDLGNVDRITTDPEGGVTCGEPGEANDVTCDLGDLATGASGVVTVGFRTSTTPDPSPVSLTVSSSTGDPDIGNNSDDDEVQLTDAGPGFAPARSYELAGTGAHSVVTGDFDGDENDDVVVSHAGGNASFLSGSGGGELDPAAEIELAGTPRWMAAGDVDNDGDLDLIANTEVCPSGSTCGTLQLATGNGDGTFDAPVAIDVANGPASIALADVNDDGDLDLLAADTVGADLSVSLGNGNGTFPTADASGTGGGRYGIEVGQLDEDSLPDVVVTGGTVALVFLNQGGGNFAGGVSYPTGSTSPSPNPSLADVNEDNAPDLVVSGSARVLLNAGDGTFGEAAEAVDTAAFSAVTGDFNGDGRVDVEAATGSTDPLTGPDLVQRRGAGDGSFGSGPSATLQYRVSTSIAKGDLDGDGTPDLIVPHDDDDKVTVLLATPTPGIQDLEVSHGPDDTFAAGYSPLDQRSLDFAAVDLDPAILSGAAGPLAAPLQGRPLQGRPLQGRPLQGRPLQGRPLQGRPLQGRFLTEPPPSAFSFASFESLVNHQIASPPLITEIGLDVAGGWPAQLTGTSLANLPPQEVDLNEVISNTTVWNRVRDITLDRFDLSQTALGNLPPIAELAGSAPLTAFAPVGSWTGPGGWLETMAPVCATTIDVSNTNQTLVDLALARCPLTVVPWETLRVRDFSLTATNSLLYSYGILGLDPSAIPLGTGNTTLGDLPLADVPTGIVDCGLITCTGGHTLGDAYDEMIATNDYVLLRTATFTKFLTGGATNGGGTATAADLIGDLTTEQLLLGAIAPQDFPYVLLSTNQLLDAAPATSSGAIPYSAAFDVNCPTPADTSIAFALPSARFGFVRGTGEFHIGPTGSAATVPAGNPQTDGNVLRWDLPDNATVCDTQTTGTTHVVLDFLAQPAPATGVFGASASITTGANDTLRSLDPEPITLTESEAGPDADHPQSIGPNDLVLGQFASPSDVNYYRIPVTPSDVGALVTVVLSNGNDPQTAGLDNDLVIYGSAEENLAAAPLQGRPLQGRPLGDQEGCLPAGYVLNSQGLEGVPHVDGNGRAVRGFSTNRSDYPEIACTTVQESDVADGILVQVSHFAGTTGDHPYVLSHTVEQVDVTAGCVGPDLQYAADAQQHGRTPTTAQYSRVIDAGDEVPSGATTLFVLNADRLGDLYGYDFTSTQPASIAEKQILDDLQALAQRPEVNGYILPVETSAMVAAEYADLASDPCSPTEANQVVSAINTLIRDVETPAVGPRVRPDNVVIVGDDDVVPFARLRDLTTLGNQVAYAPNIHSPGGPNPISKAFSRGYILSDDPFGTTLAPISFLGNIAYVPDTALGRLVETPDEMHGQIQQYVAVDGTLDPTTRLSTGADFASDVGQQIADTFKDQTDALNDEQAANPYSTKALLTSASAPWTAEPGWNRARMLCRLDGSDASSGCTRGGAQDFTPPGVIAISGHANHISTLAGNGVDVVTTDDIAGISRNATDGTAIPDGSLLFTIGCNAGVNVPDSYLPAPDEFDFPQALASRRGSMVGNFGFGYGDTTRLAFSEKLMKLFADNLDGSATIGRAIVEAKGAYWSQLVTSSPYDVKSLEQSTLYGLPFYEITGTGNTNANNAPPVVVDTATGLSSSVLRLPRPNSNDDFFVHPTDDRRGGGPDGEFFVGPNAQVVPGQPIQPASNPFFLTQPGLRLHGALITQLSVQDFPNFDPVISRLLLDGSPGTGTEPIVQSGVFPTAHSTITTVQGNDYLVLNGGRFTATGEDVGTQRIHTSETARALYSTRTDPDFTAPDVTASGQLIGNGYATFTIRSLASDVTAAYVMYRPGGGPNADDFQLVRLLPTSPGVYSATVQVGSNGVAEFFGEVVDDSGNVGFDVLKGATVALQTVSVTPPPGVTTRIIPDAGTQLDAGSGFYTGPVDVEIVQRSFSGIQAQVDFGAFKTFTPTFSGTTARVDVPATGNADGVHRVDYMTGGRTGTVVVPIDGLPPDIQYQIGVPNSGTGPGAPYVTPGTSIGIVVTDASSGVADCTIERFFPPGATSGTSFPCDEGSNPVTLGDQDGRYRFRTVATDNAGHTVTKDEVITVTRDTTPPTVTPTVGSPRHPASDPQPYVRTITDITMTIVDPPADDVAGSGVATCSTTMTGPIPSAGPAPAAADAGCDPLASAQPYHAAGPDGTYRFDTTATDRLDNEGSASQTVRLDNTEPTVSVALPATSSPTYVSGATTFVTSATNLNTATADPASVSGPGSGVATCLTSLAAGGTMAPGTVATVPNPAACTSPSHTYTLPGTTPDGPYVVKGTADDHVGNHNTGVAGNGSSGPLSGITLDNTAPIFGMCPTVPLQRSATVLSASGTGTGTSFNVNEEATPPRVPFVIKIDNELMKVTKRVLIAGTTSQYTYTVARAQGSTSLGGHGAGSEIAWNLLARQDLLGTPNAAINATQTTIQVKEERFGAPALPFTIVAGNEQMRVTARTTPTSGGVSTYTVARGANGTVAGGHTTSAKIYWAGEAAGVVNTALTATGTSMSVVEGRFGPSSVPFDVTVEGERMTVVHRTVGAGQIATYTVVRGVDGTTASAHGDNAAVVPPPVGAVYLNSPAGLRTLSIGAVDDLIFPGVHGSGVASNSIQTVPANAVGTYPVTFTAADNLGNTRTKLCSYEVIYKFSGFYLPVDMSIVNPRNAGAAVPTKWKITDFNLVGQTSPTTFKEITASKTIPATSTACSASNPDFSVASEDVRGGSALQNQGGGAWQYNWSPKTAKGTCTTMTVRLRQSGLSNPDPTRWYQYAVFRFK
jgi:CSLREA domain-containing protein